MIRRVALVLPFAFALGCGAAPPPAAAPPAAEASATTVEEAKKQGAPAQGSPAPGAAPVAPAAAGSGPPQSIGKAAVSSTTDAPLTSTITQDEVIHQVGKSSELFNRCYALGAGASKSWRAKVTVKATVGPNGNVSAAEVVSSTTKNPKVDACVVESFKKLSFPRPKGSGTTTFTFPLSFDGVEQVR